MTMSNTTVTINGLNQPVDNTDRIPDPEPHPWSEAIPIQSRNNPMEDSFSALYNRVAAISILRPNSTGLLQFTLMEDLLIVDLTGHRTLATLEKALVQLTGIALAALGETYGYANISR